MEAVPVRRPDLEIIKIEQQRVSREAAVYLERIKVQPGSADLEVVAGNLHIGLCKEIEEADIGKYRILLAGIYKFRMPDFKPADRNPRQAGLLGRSLGLALHLEDIPVGSSAVVLLRIS